MMFTPPEMEYHGNLEMGETNDQLEITPKPYVHPIKPSYTESLTSSIVSGFRRRANYPLCLDSAFNLNVFKNTLCMNQKEINFTFQVKRLRKERRLKE